MPYAIVAVIALILDQLIKYWTTVNIVVDTGEAKLIPGLIHLANVHNTGAAFSFLEGARWFFVILCLIFVLIVVYALVKNLITDKVCRWAAIFVLAGAVGNCIDRILNGYVVDMFEFDFLIFKRPFPVFNLADIFITLGVIAFCVALLLEKPAPKAKKAAGDAADGTDAAPRPTGFRFLEKKAASGEKQAAPAAERAPLIRRKPKPVVNDLHQHDLSDVPPLDPTTPLPSGKSAPAHPKPLHRKRLPPIRSSIPSLPPRRHPVPQNRRSPQSASLPHVPLRPLLPLRLPSPTSSPQPPLPSLPRMSLIWTPSLRNSVICDGTADFYQ